MPIGSADAFTYTVDDGHSGTSTATLTITLKPGVKQDFNADAHADILFRNTTTGAVSLWEMNNGQIAQSLSVSGLGNTNMNVVGTGDFNGDLSNDILWRNTTDGSLSLWEMNGAQTIAAHAISGPIPTSWQVAATGDFNGDGKADILWRDTAGGSVGLWEMNGFQPVVEAIIAGVPINSGWQIVGAGDFNGDGKADILWNNTVDGSLGVWEMNGLQIVAAAGIGNVPINGGWQIDGIGDFNGDSKADILWQNTNGTVAIWEMNGLQIAAANVVGSVAPTSGWQIAGTGDYSGDGKADILWQNTSTKAVAVWEMNGFQISSAQMVSMSLPTNSSIVRT